MGKNKNKNRIRKKISKVKGIRWKKGSSSSSNPKIKKHRNMAKNICGERKGQGTLTKEALAQLDSLHCKKNSDNSITDEETQSFGGESFASTWSDCSNICFDRLLKNWQVSSSLHKEMLSVLAAVTEIIKSKDGKESETEYFAALVTALESVETDESTTAVVILLSMIIKRVPPTVLKLKFSDTSKVLIGLLEKYMDSMLHALVRGVIHCLAVLLRNQEISVWKLPSTNKIYNSILVLTIHSKPKVRKAAHHAICSILKGSEVVIQSQSIASHPSASLTAKFCIKTIEEHGGGKNCTTTLHILGLLKEILHVFPHAQLKAACEVILKIMVLGNTLVISCSFQALYGMFQNKPSHVNLSPELNAQIISALYDYQPSIGDSQLTCAWLTVMDKAFCNLYRLNEELFIGHLPKFFDICTRCWLSEKQEVWTTVTNILNNLLTECLKYRIDKSLSDTNLDDIMIIDKLFQSIEKCLKYQYHLAWSQVLKILAVCFELMGKYQTPIMIKCLQSLADLRDSNNFSCSKELDRAVGKAVTSMGPDVILEVIALDFNLDNNKLDFPRSWLLPVIRDNVRDTKLEFFTNYFLPLATKVQKKALECQELKRAIETKFYNMIQSQIWSMLPGFCSNPTDFPQSFKGIAKILGTALNNRPDLRLDILASLRTLIRKNLENDLNKQELSKYAKNYLPILFNLYTTEHKNSYEESVRLAVYDTIKIYLLISDKELCMALFQKGMAKLQEPNISNFNRHAVLDICRALMLYIDEDCLEALYNYCKPLLQHSDRTVQKKSYRVLEEMCQGKTEICQVFVNNHLQELKDTLLVSLSASSLSSKAPRLRCLRYIVQQLDNSNIDFVTSIIPEAVFCIKENAEKVREGAYDLILEIGHTFVRWDAKNSETAIQKYVELLLAGLAGTPHFISATILCLGRVMFEFKGQIPSSIIKLLMENALTLLTSSSREITNSTLSFIKSLFSALDSNDIAQHIEVLVKNLINCISKDGQRQLKFKTKDIFARLIRKFGIETIIKFVPNTHKKFINNVWKSESRKKRQKLSDENNVSYKKKNDESDYSSDEEQSENKSKQTGSWIEEQSEEIVDFLAPSVSKNVLATKPGIKNVKNPFKTAPDGRLIISEDKEEESNKRKASIAIDMLDDSENLSMTKRSKTDNSEDEMEQNHAKFAVVNKGIHRKIKEKNIEFGQEYKAKKAGGDIKRKGQPDPYVYIPFNRKALNKRKTAKMSGQFKGVIKAAKKGAHKGKQRRHHKGKK